MSRFNNNRYQAICETINNFPDNHIFTVAELIQLLNNGLTNSYCSQILSKLKKCDFITYKKDDKTKTIIHYIKLKQIPEINLTDLELLGRTKIK